VYVVVIHGRKTNGKDPFPWWTEATWWLRFFLKAFCMIGRKIRYLKHVDHKEDCEQELPKIKCKSPSPKPFKHFDRSHGF
jgi:hypothetical protein